MTITTASGKQGNGPAAGAQASAVGSPTASPTTQNRRDNLRKWAEILLFVGPAVGLFFTFVVYPVAQAARYSFYKWNGIEQFSQAEYIGLDNYRRVLTGVVDGNDVFKSAYSEPFWEALGHNFAIIALSMAIQLPLALLIALILNRVFPGRTAMRLVIFAPYVLSEVIAGIMWLIIFDPNGIATNLAERVGLGMPGNGWFEDQTWGFWTVFFIVTWKYLGLAIILFLAGLSGVPKELQEASSIDGATWWQTQWRINVPLIGPTIRIWAFLSIIGSLQLFDMVWVLGRGGTTGQYSTIATFMMDRGFFRSDMGFGSAIAVIMFVISLAIALVYMAVILRRDNTNDNSANAR